MNSSFRFLIDRPGQIEWLLLALILSAAAGGGTYLSAEDIHPEIMPMHYTEALIYERVNKERALQGLAELVWAPDVAKIARRHSAGMGTNEYFSHAGTDGELVGDRLEKAGIVFDAAAENLFRSINISDIVEEAILLWTQSPGHRKNMFNTDFTETGIGLYKSVERNAYYVTQVFIKRGLKFQPPPSRINNEQIDNIFDIIKASLEEFRYDYDYNALKGRILSELDHAGIRVRENPRIKCFLKDTQVLDLTTDFIASNGFIIKFVEGDLEEALQKYSRLVSPQGYSAAVLIKESDGKVRFSIIKTGN